MARWHDATDEQAQARLRQLARQLRQQRPRGWSVTISDENEIVVRPENRDLGKFSITQCPAGWTLAFFSRALGYWSLYTEVPGTADAAALLRTRMESKVTLPSPSR